MKMKHLLIEGFCDYKKSEKNFKINLGVRERRET